MSRVCFLQFRLVRRGRKVASHYLVHSYSLDRVPFVSISVLGKKRAFTPLLSMPIHFHSPQDHCMICSILSGKEKMNIRRDSRQSILFKHPETTQLYNQNSNIYYSTAPIDQLYKQRIKTGVFLSISYTLFTVKGFGPVQTPATATSK